MRTDQHGMSGSRLVLATLLTASGLVLTGCSLFGPTQGPTPRDGTLLPEGTTEVEVTAGEIVQVSLPEGSLGVGDFWGVISVSAPDVAGAEVAIGERVFGVEPSEREPAPAGGTQQFAVEIEGLAPGESTVRVLYCTRTKTVSEDCDQSQGTLEAPVDPVEIVVRVE